MRSKGHVWRAPEYTHSHWWGSAIMMARLPASDSAISLSACTLPLSRHSHSGQLIVQRKFLKIKSKDNGIYIYIVFVEIRIWSGWKCFINILFSNTLLRDRTCVKVNGPFNGIYSSVVPFAPHDFARNCTSRFVTTPEKRWRRLCNLFLNTAS